MRTHIYPVLGCIDVLVGIKDYQEVKDKLEEIIRKL